jgi:menaquinone-specific isochorismate synthase
VVEGIKKALSPFGKVKIGAQEIVPYGSLYHLKTLIELKAEVPFDLLVKELHPTPALGAWPRDAGNEWLQKWGQIRPRGRFGAPFGYVYPQKDEARVFVAIRCVQWKGEEAALWAGAGVTSKSCFAKEKQEVLQKLKMISALMGI